MSSAGIFIPPPFEEDPLPLPSTMILDGTVLLENIQLGNSESHQIEDTNAPLIVIPSDSSGEKVVHEYVAQAVCDSTPFRDLIREKYGKAISVVFLGKEMFGYITEYEIDDHNETISFTYERIAIYDQPEEPEYRLPTR